MYKIEIYTDGACYPNPGVGGYAAILVAYDGNHVIKEMVVSGYAYEVTNNVMELTAAIEGLKALTKSCAVTVISDSQYLVKTMTDGWSRGKNKDLWNELDALSEQHDITWQWVRGHAGNYYTERHAA